MMFGDTAAPHGARMIHSWAPRRRLRQAGMVLAMAGGLAFSTAALADFVVVNEVQPSTVVVTQPSELTVTLKNNNNYEITGVGMAVPIKLPSGVVASDLDISSLATSCTPGTLTVSDDAGFIYIELAGATLESGGAECTITADLAATKPGTYNMRIEGQTATSDQGDSNAQTTNFDWRVDGFSPIRGAKRFDKSNLRGGDTSTVTITLTNNNAVPLTGLKFSDSLHADFKLATPHNFSSSCGSLQLDSGSINSMQFSGGSIAADSSCEVTFDVSPSDPRAYKSATRSNAIAANNIETDQGVTNSSAFSGSTTVRSGVRIVKEFRDSPVWHGDNTARLRIRVYNYNAVDVTGFAFTDSLPTGVTDPVLTGGSCNAHTGNGTLTVTADSFTWSGATLEPSPANSSTNNSCYLEFTYTPDNTGGSFIEPTNDAGNITGVAGQVDGEGPVEPRIEGATVVINPTGPGGGGISATKNFRQTGATGGVSSSLSGVRQGGDFEMVFTFTNHNTSHDATGVQFTDDLGPMGSSAEGNYITATGIVENSCSLGTSTAGGNLSINGGTIPAGATCTLVVQARVEGFATRSWTEYNRIGPGSNQLKATIDGSERTWGGLDFARVNVLETLSVEKAFDPVEISSNLQTSLMTITLNREANAPKLTGMAFSDILPKEGDTSSSFDLIVLNVADNTCGGTVDFDADTVSLSGGELDGPGGNLTQASSCDIVLEVEAPDGTEGSITNTIAADAITTDQRVTNRVKADATLGANTASVTLSKNFAPVILADIGEVSTLELKVQNTQGAPAQDAFELVDDLPAGMVVADPANVSTNAACGPSIDVTADPGSSVVKATAGSLAKNATCSIKVDVEGQALGNIINEIPAGNLTTDTGLANEEPASATISINGKGDVATEITNPDPVLARGEATTYTVSFFNNGDDPVFGNDVSIDLPADILPTDLDDIEWTCTATGSAVCPLGDNGTGPVPDHQLSLPATGDGEVTYEITFPVGPNAPDTGSAEAKSHIKAPAVVQDTNPDNDDSDVSNPLFAPSIAAGDDSYGPMPSPATDTEQPGTILDNDTLNGNPVNPADVDLTVDNSNWAKDGDPGYSGPAPTVGSDGKVTVPAGLEPGTYTVPYRICDKIYPDSCADAVVTVIITSNDIAASPDEYGPMPSPDTDTVQPGTILDNDTLNGGPVTLDDVDLTVDNDAWAKDGDPGYSGPAPTVGPDGKVTVPADLEPGTYTVPYTITDKNDPDNSADSTVTVIILPEIDAQPDEYGPMPSPDADTVQPGTILDNDTLNGDPVTLDDVDLTVDNDAWAKEGDPDYDGPFPSVGGDGKVTVPAGIKPGTYVVDYEICDVNQPDNCATAQVRVIITAAGGVAPIPTLGQWGMILLAAMLAGVTLLRRREQEQA